MPKTSPNSTHYLQAKLYPSQCLLPNAYGANKFVCHFCKIAMMIALIVRAIAPLKGAMSSHTLRRRRRETMVNVFVAKMMI